MSQSTEGKSVIVQGRIVWTSGDLFVGRKKLDQQTKQVKLNTQGQELMEHGFGLSISKADVADPNKAGSLWMAIHQEASSIYPSGIPPRFAWKYKDGDSIDDQGRPFALREGYQGCLVFALTTTLVIRYFRYEGGQNILVADGIKCGDYVNVQIGVKAHGPVGQGLPGLYLNPQMVQLVAPGKEIINAPTGDQVFGTGAPPMPAGYVPPPMPGMPAAVAPVGQYPSPVAPPAPYQAPAPIAPPQPHYGVIPSAFQPPPGGQYPSPVAPPAPYQAPAPIAPPGYPAVPR